MKVKIKKLHDAAVIPVRAHASDAGMDLVAVSKTHDREGNLVYGTGLAMEIPAGHVGLVFPRSSNAKKLMYLTNSVGVIDSGYRGEIMLKYKRVPPYYTTFRGDGQPEWEIGDKVGQIIILPYPEVTFNEVDELTSSDRGTGGYGSSDK